MLITAVISRHDSAHQWAEAKLVEQFGSVALFSPHFQFRETSFYERTMGTDLTKRFLAFADPIDAAMLADHKRLSNSLEKQYATEFEHDEPRPLNLDPGYITAAKLVLATTKNRDHRIYLRDGIFAEVTLHYKKSGWAINPWTYPNYQRPDFHEFFDSCRRFLRAGTK